MSGRSRRLAARQRQERRRAAGMAAVVVVLAVLVVVVVSSLGGDDGSESAAGASLEVSMVEMAFVPDPIEAAVGDARLRIVNDGEVAHSLVIPELGKGSPDVDPGGSFDLDLTEQPAGTYVVICDIAGHREAGMETTLVLS